MRSSLFEILPADVIRYMSRYLHLHGPSVQLIEGGPSDEEKKIVMAVALDDRGKPNPNRPHLNTYHLIARYSNEKREIEYSIGFCKKRHNLFDSSLEYRIQLLDEKSPLLRYVTEDLTHRQYSKLFPYDSEKKGTYTRSQDRVLLKYMELEIKAAGGLTCHRLRNRTRLAAVCRNSHAFMNALESNKPLLLEEQSIQQAFFNDLVEHESFGEIKEARAILKLYPQLLLSHFSGELVGCAPELTFHHCTVFQKAYAQGNWFFTEMAVDVLEQSPQLSETDKAGYKEVLLAQIAVVEEGQLECTLDNLLNKGVRIIDADTLVNNTLEEQRLIQEIVERDGYHLIINMQVEEILSCTLGYRDPKSKAYARCEIPKEDLLFTIAGELFQRLHQANGGQGNRHTHCFTRHNRDLALVKVVLQKLSIETQFRQKNAGLHFLAHPMRLEGKGPGMGPSQKAFELNFGPLRVAVGKLINNWSSWSVRRRLDHLHGTIYAECRLFPAIVWQFWMSEYLPGTGGENEMGAFDLERQCDRQNFLDHFLFYFH